MNAQFFILINLTKSEMMELPQMAYIITAFLFFFTLDNAAGSSVCNLVHQPFQCHHYNVKTTDGYELGLQRIYHRGRGSANKIPVLLQHGILSDATTWLANSRNESLGFILADNNYDVWLANVRGTKSSLGHINSTVANDPEYWNWSWDELAAYDLPAFVKFIHRLTGQKIHYVGHSLGTLMALAAFSEQEVVSRVRSAALLCPIAYMDQTRSRLVKRVAYLFGHQPLYWTGPHKFSVGGRGKLGTELMDKVSRVCKKYLQREYCNNPVNLITGPNCCLRSKPFQAQAPTSIKNLIHLAQMIRHGTIQKYDYGSRHRNYKHYRQSTPPAYHITNIPKNLPILLAHGGTDYLSDSKDVQKLKEELAINRDKRKVITLYRRNYGHLDFVGGTNAKEDVYEVLMKFLYRN